MGSGSSRFFKPRRGGHSARATTPADLSPRRDGPSSSSRPQTANSAPVQENITQPHQPLELAPLSTPRRQENETAEANSLPYTPIGEEAKIYKYYCPLCMVHFNGIMKAKCCSNYICKTCFADYMVSKNIGNEVNVSNMQNNLLLDYVSCPHCTTTGFYLEFVNSTEEVRDYSRKQISEENRNLREADLSNPPSPVRVGESFEDLKRKMIPYQQAVSAVSCPDDGDGLLPSSRNIGIALQQEEGKNESKEPVDPEQCNNEQPLDAVTDISNAFVGLQSNQMVVNRVGEGVEGVDEEEEEDHNAHDPRLNLNETLTNNMNNNGNTVIEIDNENRSETVEIGNANDGGLQLNTELAEDSSQEVSPVKTDAYHDCSGPVAPCDSPTGSLQFSEYLGDDSFDMDTSRDEGLGASTSTVNVSTDVMLQVSHSANDLVSQAISSAMTTRPRSNDINNSPPPHPSVNNYVQ